MPTILCACRVALVAAAFAVVPAGIAVARPATSIDLWVRKGGAAPGDPARQDLRAIDLDTLPTVEVRHPDVQYHGTFAYRGVPLQTLIDRYAPAAGADLALLHFANGMQIPYAFRDAALARQLDLFVATAIRPSAGASWRVGAFPKIRRPRSGFADVRPIVFGAIKLVVADPAHPAVPTDARPVLSPWLHVDSLTGVEFVSEKAYRAQYDVDPDPAVKAGYRLFHESCQFCHGVRGVGAAFGWDFVEPTPMYDYRGQKNLFYHVKYKPLDATARGIQMPALSHLTEQDAAALWQWMRAVATHPLAAYLPAAAGP